MIERIEFRNDLAVGPNLGKEQGRRLSFSVVGTRRVQVVNLFIGI